MMLTAALNAMIVNPHKELFVVFDHVAIRLTAQTTTLLLLIDDYCSRSTLLLAENESLLARKSAALFCQPLAAV